MDDDAIMIRLITVFSAALLNQKNGGVGNVMKDAQKLERYVLTGKRSSAQNE